MSGRELLYTGAIAAVVLWACLYIVWSQAGS